MNTTPTLPPIGSIVRMKEKFWEINPAAYSGAYVYTHRDREFIPGTLHEVLAHNEDGRPNQIRISDGSRKSNVSSICPVEWVELVEADKPAEPPQPTITETELAKAMERVKAEQERVEGLRELADLEKKADLDAKRIAELRAKYLPPTLVVEAKWHNSPDSKTPGFCEPHQPRHDVKATGKAKVSRPAPQKPTRAKRGKK